MKNMIFGILCLLIVGVTNAQQACPVPLYSDPSFKGSADPEVIWNAGEKEWWIFYTNRQSVCEGCPLPARSIGVATSKDWIHWKHKGYIKVDGIGGKPLGPDVLWAPGIIRDGDTYHMFLTFKKGHFGRWGIPESLILHLTAPKDDLLDGWATKGIMRIPFASIDATIIKNDNTWTLFHRGINKKRKGVNTYQISTKNIDARSIKWSENEASLGDVNDKTVNGYNYQEGQFVFYWKGYFWMLTDPPNKDIAAYSSKNLKSWKLNNAILDKEGKSKFQKGTARHTSVVVLDDRAFVFYFNQPFRKEKNNPDREQCFLEVSELKLVNGKLTADRNAPVIPPKNLVPQDGEWGQKKK